MDTWIWNIQPRTSLSFSFSRARAIFTLRNNKRKKKKKRVIYSVRKGFTCCHRQLP